VVQKAKPFPVVPVNPRSIAWARKRALELVRQGMSHQQKTVVRKVISDGFSKGIRAEAVYERVRRNIGLTDRYAAAVERRRQLHEDAGLPENDVDRLTAEYEESLMASRAVTIARTETSFAQAVGRNEVWQQAQDSGELPEVERIWITGPEHGDPNAPCPICTALDGKRAPIGGYYTCEYGDFDSVPAEGGNPGRPHPRCSCAEALIRADETDMPLISSASDEKE
jgi:hypothetical protein